MSKTFEDFPVYQKGLQLIRMIENHCLSTKSGRYGFLKDQIRRAASSIILNIAEGSGKWNKKDKINFYRMSQASADECLAAIDLFVVYELISQDNALAAKKQLREIIIELQALKMNIEKRKA